MAEEQKKNGEDGAEDEDEITIEFVDDTPEEDQGRPRKKPEAKSDDDDDDDDSSSDDDDDDDDDERRNYSSKVQKRIKKLKYEFHEQRRAREEAERLREEAVTYSQRITGEVERMRKQLTEGEGVLYTQAEGRIDAQIKSSQRELREAYDAGDSEKIVEAQTQLSNLVAEKSRITQYKPRPQAPTQRSEAAPAQQAAPRANAAPKPSQRALDWQSRNDWFNKDARMTAVAYTIHKEAIESGVAPDSPEYYRQIDKEVRKTFPSHFASGAEGQGNLVAAPSRNAGSKPRIVRLNKTQLQFCKRLGVTPEQYAKEMIKQEKSNDK